MENPTWNHIFYADDTLLLENTQAKTYFSLHLDMTL